MYEDIQPDDPRLSDPKYFDVLPEFMRESMNRDRWYWRWDTPEKYTINMRAYFRMMTGMDRVIGKVVDKLEEKGLADNTVIIFTADNGYYMGDRGFAGKWSHFEQSLRVPMIIYDPRLPEKQRSRVVDPMALNIDLTATRVTMACLRHAGENAGTARHADGCGDKSVLEPHALFGEAVQDGRLDDRMAGTPHRVVAHVIRKDEQDVGLVSGRHGHTGHDYQE